MNCPRCKTAVGPLSSPDSIVTCPGCGSRLMTKAAARRSQGGPSPEASVAGETTASAPAAPAEPKPALVPLPASTPVPTLAPTPAFVPEMRPAPSPLTHSPLPPLSATLTPTAGVVVGAVSRREPPMPAPANGQEQVLRELRAVREIQERILAMLEQAMAAPAARGGAAEDGPTLSPIRAPRRKSVVLIDDDEASCEAAARELEEADVPVRTFGDGNDALRGIAEQKPDLIVLELGLGGDMAGKDVINVIKATMEWVDIPIVLWTREPVANQKEARQIHGADEIVPKSAGAAGLVARVINVFRRG
jgi:twitching motility two-component system response regulator PilH